MKVEGCGGLALFHIVHRSQGPDGSPPVNLGLGGSILIDLKVDVDRFLVAECRACRGQVKNVAFSKL